MKIKKAIISLLAILPISSVTFAVDYHLNYEKRTIDPDQVEEEFLRRLEDNKLPLKYYRFLKEQGIKNSDEFLSDDNAAKKKRLLEEYYKDYITPMEQISGTVSMM